MSNLSRRALLKASIAPSAVGIALNLDPAGRLFGAGLERLGSRQLAPYPNLAERPVNHRFGAIQAEDMLSFEQVVETPTGTPLGGWVHVDVYRDGRYYVKFHMHSSSVVGDFDFDLRAYLSAPNFPTLAFLHSGHVSGVDSSDFEEWGDNPLIPIYWDQLVAAPAYAVAKEYSWGGIVGGAMELVKDLLDLGAGIVGSALGCVIGATREAIGWLGAALGPGTTLGVIGGAVIFAVGVVAGAPIGAALIVATVAGAAIGIIAEALIDYRPINQAEIELARRVFGDSMPYGDIILTNLAGMGGRAFVAPGVDGKTYVNLGSAYERTLSASPNSYPYPGQLLIHELTHAWQIAHTSFLPGLMCSGIVNQVQYAYGDDVYSFGEAGPAWSEFNAEQQGSIVDQWYGGNQNSDGFKPMDQQNPYYRYVWNDLLAKQPPSTAPANLRTSSGPVVSRTPELLDVFWVTPDGALASTAWDASGEGWIPPFPITDPSTAAEVGPTSLSRMPDHLDVFWVAPDGAVVSTWWDATAAGWFTPFAIAPAGSASPGPVTAVSRTPDHLDVFWVTLDGAVASTWWNADEAEWFTPFQIAPAGSAAGAVTAITRTPDHIDVFWVSPDGAVAGTWWDASGGGWFTPFQIAPAGSASPTSLAVASRTPDHIDMFWIAPDGSVASTWWDASGGGWFTPFQIAPAGSAAESVSVITRTPEQIDVFWAAPDSAVASTWWNPDAGAWYPPFAVAPAGSTSPRSLTAVCRTPLNLDVYWIAPDGSVASTGWDANGTGWFTPFQIAPAGSAMT